MDKTNHPFQPGVKVAVVSGYSDNFRIAEVDKLYKTGKFTLKSDDLAGQPAEQWKAYQYGAWMAQRTGDSSFSRLNPVVKLYDDQFKHEAEKIKTRASLNRRASAAIKKVRGTRADCLTEWQVEQLEYFVRLCDAHK
jgi:hypothetical protein